MGDTHEFSPVLNYNEHCSIKKPTMPREKTIRVRLSDAEYEALKSYAKETDRMISEVIRDYIKELMRKPSSEGRGLNPIIFGHGKKVKGELGVPFGD
jgi:hypothetical protein